MGRLTPNCSYELSTLGNYTDEEVEEMSEYMAQMGPYICIDWDHGNPYHRNVVDCYLFSDPRFATRTDDHLSYEYTLSEQGLDIYFAIAHTIRCLRNEALFSEDDIRDYMEMCGEEYFPDIYDAILKTCLKIVGTNQLFYFPEWD